MLLLWCRLILVGAVCDVAQVLSEPLGVQSCVRVSPFELWGARMLHGVFMFGQALRSGGVYYLTESPTEYHTTHHTVTTRCVWVVARMYPLCSRGSNLCRLSICFCLWLAANAN